MGLGALDATCLLLSENIQQFIYANIVGPFAFASLGQKQPCHKSYLENFWAIALASCTLGVWQGFGFFGTRKSQQAIGSVAPSQDTLGESKKGALGK